MMARGGLHSDMKTKIVQSLVAAAALFAPGCAKSGALILAKDGRSDYRIVLARSAPPLEIRAAAELQKYLREMNGVTIPIVSDEAPPQDKEILIGNNRRLNEIPVSFSFPELGDDGFIMRTIGQKLIIVCGREKGDLYSVYSLLEDHLGCRKYAEDSDFVPEGRRSRSDPSSEIKMEQILATLSDIQEQLRKISQEK
jgi:hypothetical protein